MNYLYLLLLIPVILIAGFIIQLIKTMKAVSDSSCSSESERKKYKPSDTAVRSLTKSITIKTVSNDNPELEDEKAFKEFKDFLGKEYSSVYKASEVFCPGDRSIIIHLKGSDSSLKPACMMAHYDVVDPNELSKWKYPPFSGEVAEGFIWGRGTQDIKIHLISLLEAAKKIVEAGDKPLRDIWFAFGGDEEVGGERGAAANVAFFKERGIQFEYVLDEGAAIVDGMVGFIKKPVAMIGIAEKGRVTVKLEVQGKPGHSAMPPAHTAAGIIGKAVAAVEKHPFKSKMNYSVSSMLYGLAGSSPAPINFFLANNRFYTPLLKKILSKTPAMDVLMHTTQAVTVLHSGVKENIIPETAEALINLRIVPGETMQSCVDHIRHAINDNRVAVSIWDGFPGNDPIKPVDVNSTGFELVAETVSEVLPGIPAIPYMVTASTDSRSYSELSETILRFTPVVFQKDDLAGIHGYNEKISLENYGLAIEYFYKLIKE